MSAFATVVGRLGDLSESELRQLYLIVGVRLGIPDGASAGGSRQGRGKSTAKNQKGSKAAPGPGTPGNAGKKPSKGNPSRKSQWETHPLYREYKRLKKVVETQAKESKTPFASVDTPERGAYNLALEQWLEAKSSFRDRGDTAAKGEEASSSKGKGKAPVLTGGASTCGLPFPTDKVGPSSWADDAQREADGDSSSGEDEDLPDAPGPEPAGSGAAGGSQIVVDGRNPPVHNKPTPPKNSGAGKKTRK